MNKATKKELNATLESISIAGLHGERKTIESHIAWMEHEMSELEREVSYLDDELEALYEMEGFN